MDYYCFDIKVAKPLTEIALAFLSELPFESFEEFDEGLRAYLPRDNKTENVESELANIAAQLSFSYERRLIPAQNWNELWEANFSPIRVGDLCGVRAHFHPRMDGVQYEIVINPRMAFGTGHHATTFMMMERMAREKFEGLQVLDYGCGTGILAILADKMGAALIDAVDIEQASYENTLDNAQANHATHIRAYHGTLADIEATGYGYILANINRNVILNSLKSLYAKLAPGGVLLVSGILTADESLVLNRAAEVKLQFTDKAQRGEWSCIRFVR